MGGGEGRRVVHQSCRRPLPGREGWKTAFQTINQTGNTMMEGILGGERWVERGEKAKVGDCSGIDFKW